MRNVNRSDYLLVIDSLITAPITPPNFLIIPFPAGHAPGKLPGFFDEVQAKSEQSSLKTSEVELGVGAVIQISRVTVHLVSAGGNE